MHNNQDENSLNKSNKTKYIYNSSSLKMKNKIIKQAVWTCDNQITTKPSDIGFRFQNDTSDVLWDGSIVDIDID